jgi:hypothetical protein
LEQTKILKDHIVALYCERYNCRQIAELTGLSYRYVTHSLKERGITPVKRVVRSSRGGARVGTVAAAVQRSKAGVKRL